MPMKRLTLCFILTILSCSDRQHKQHDQRIQVDLSGTDFTTENTVVYDRFLNSDYSVFKLPSLHCPVEQIDFNPEFRVYYKYMGADSLDYQVVSDELYAFLEKRFKVLSAMMCPFDSGHLFGFTVLGQHRLLYRYHMIALEHKPLLIETVSTLGTKRQTDEYLEVFLKRIKAIKRL